jgi:HlyD family secretion protein
MVKKPNPARRGTSVRRKAIVVGIALGVTVCAGVGISAAFASSAPGLVTSTANVETVNHTLSTDGMLEPVNDADAEFQVSGTVSGVDVKVGEKIAAGETLATLDTTSLEADVTEALSTLASAEAKLTEDEENEDTETTSNDGAAQASTSAIESGSDSIDLDSAIVQKGGSGSFSSDQAAIVTDQHALDSEMQVVGRDLMTVQSACSSTESSGGGGSSSSATTTTTTPTTTPTMPPTTSTTAPTTTTTSPGGSPTPCETALSAANSAEQEVSSDEQTLASAESELAKLLSSTVTSSGGSSSSGSSKTSQSTGSSKTDKSASGSEAKTSGSGASKSQSSGSSSSISTDTPEQLASDESTIDSDQASVVDTEQSLAAAKLVSPISGTVETVAITAGDSVSADSPSEAVTIVDWRSYEVTASLTTSEVQDVNVGQECQITVDGISGTLDAKVTRVGPVEEIDSSYVYPVVMTVTSDAETIPAGSAAAATIALAKAQDVLVVPTSAVHTSGTSNSYVYVYEKGKQVRQTVKIGLVGGIYTQIVSGLTKGDVIVLADPSEAVPSSSTNSTTFSSAGSRSFSGFGGAGTGSGGPPG